MDSSKIGSKQTLAHVPYCANLYSVFLERITALQLLLGSKTTPSTLASPHCIPAYIFLLYKGDYCILWQYFFFSVPRSLTDIFSVLSAKSHEMMEQAQGLGALARCSLSGWFSLLPDSLATWAPLISFSPPPPCDLCHPPSLTGAWVWVQEGRGGCLELAASWGLE